MSIRPFLEKTTLQNSLPRIVAVFGKPQQLQHRSRESQHHPSDGEPRGGSNPLIQPPATSRGKSHLETDRSDSRRQNVTPRQCTTTIAIIVAICHGAFHQGLQTRQGGRILALVFGDVKAGHAGLGEFSFLVLHETSARGIDSCDVMEIKANKASHSVCQSRIFWGS